VGPEGSDTSSSGGGGESDGDIDNNGDEYDEQEFGWGEVGKCHNAHPGEW